MKKEKKLNLMISIIIGFMFIAGIALIVNNKPKREGNLLLNGGFEGVDEGKPLCWRGSAWGLAKGKHAIDSSEVNDGNNSFHLKRNNVQGGIQVVSNLVKLSSGVRVDNDCIEVSFSYKGNVSCRLIFREVGVMGEEIGLKNTTGRELAVNNIMPLTSFWKDENLIIKVPEEALKVKRLAIRVQFYLAPAQQEAWIDDVAVFENE